MRSTWGSRTSRLAAVVVTLLLACSPRPPQPSASGTPTGVATDSALTGSASCRGCHARFHELWSTSFHGLAMQPWNQAVAAAVPATTAPVRVGDRTYEVTVTPERGEVVERGTGGEKRYRIAQVLGGKNVFYFLTPLDRGFLQTLPVAWDVRRREWYGTAESAVRHAPGFTTTPSDWRDRDYTFNGSCHGCHVSQLSRNHDPATDSYRTTWSEPGINCETCHGPGGTHVKTFSAAPPGQPPAELGLVRQKTLTHEQRNDSCASCHARLVPITDGFAPGERFFDHFDLGALESPDFYPDGRDLGENYTFTTWRLSRCAQSGQIDCVTCHTSSGRYRFRKPESANQACAPCHAEKVAAPARHSRHPEGSEASRCVSCHMPRTEFARMVRSDHSMRAPAPAATIAFGSPNACNLCHADRDARWADAQVRAWRGRDYQKPILEQGRLVKAAREGDAKRLPAILEWLGRPGREEVVAASLARLLRGFNDPRVVPALVALLETDPSPLVRSAAADSLAQRGDPVAVPALARATRDPYRLVRVRAVRGLAGVPPAALPPDLRGPVDAAMRELEAALLARTDDAWALTNLGSWRFDRGDAAGAASAFRDALRIRPDHVPALVNLSLAQAQLGDRTGAESSLRRALALEPGSAPARLDLGLLLAETGRVDEAEVELKAALAADPTTAAAAYNLCVLVAGRDLAEATDHCRRAAELRPGSEKYVNAYAFYLRRGGKEREAAAALAAFKARGRTARSP